MYTYILLFLEIHSTIQQSVYINGCIYIYIRIVMIIKYTIYDQLMSVTQ